MRASDPMARSPNWPETKMDQNVKPFGSEAAFLAIGSSRAKVSGRRIMIVMIATSSVELSKCRQMAIQ